MQDKEKNAGIVNLLNNNKESKKIITENLYWNGI